MLSDLEDEVESEGSPLISIVHSLTAAGGGGKKQDNDIIELNMKLGQPTPHSRGTKKVSGISQGSYY